MRAFFGFAWRSWKLGAMVGVVGGLSLLLFIIPGTILAAIVAGLFGLDEETLIEGWLKMWWLWGPFGLAYAAKYAPRDLDSL